MSSLTRDIIAIDMLKQELAEKSVTHPTDTSDGVSTDYLQILKQCLARCKIFQKDIEPLSEFEFTQLVTSSTLEYPVSSKQLFAIYVRLLEFVQEFYQARDKIVHIQENEFGDSADRRLDLLQTRAIKAKSQFKTVAKALGVEEYRSFVHQHGLPKDGWDWEQLRL
ncbi:hypothetical protein [Aestuariibacter salexigens]|uniref:hypothetical protein n=1 Tax=Aestuariibacter salexigens TaxID=226010 RepID=UPI0004140CDD|nr:hypothetical protein [Aestuariibacter salexigens]